MLPRLCCVHGLVGIVVLGRCGAFFGVQESIHWPSKWYICMEREGGGLYCVDSGEPYAAGLCGNASTLPLLQPCLSPSYICVSPPLSLARNDTLVHAVSLACAQLAAGLVFLPMGGFCN